ncbi:MAG: hypothetical protein ACOZAK_03725 [Patescibacteria group bacterium]
MTQRKNNFSEQTFMTGFGVGLAAGAIGMYLFGTDEGGKLRQELKDHWQEAVKDLLAEGTIENAEQDLWMLFKDILNQAVGDIESLKLDKAAKTKAVSITRAQKKQNLFKGV